MERKRKSNSRKGIAAKLHHVRMQLNMSIPELAAATGVSITLLSQIEHAVIDPPISILLKLAKALKLQASVFYDTDAESPKQFVVTPRSQRQTVYRSGEGYSYSYERLAANKPNKIMEPYFIAFKKNPHEADTIHQHDGEEFFYVISGQIEYSIGDEKILLTEGDSIYLDAGVPHVIRNIGETEAHGIAVIYNPVT